MGVCLWSDVCGPTTAVDAVHNLIQYVFDAVSRWLNWAPCTKELVDANIGCQLLKKAVPDGEELCRVTGGVYIFSSPSGSCFRILLCVVLGDLAYGRSSPCVLCLYNQHFEFAGLEGWGLYMIVEPRLRFALTIFQSRWFIYLNMLCLLRLIIVNLPGILCTLFRSAQLLSWTHASIILAYQHVLMC